MGITSNLENDIFYSKMIFPIEVGAKAGEWRKLLKTSCLQFFGFLNNGAVVNQICGVVIVTVHLLTESSLQRYQNRPEAEKSIGNRKQVSISV